MKSVYWILDNLKIKNYCLHIVSVSLSTSKKLSKAQAGDTQINPQINIIVKLIKHSGKNIQRKF